MKIAVPFFVIMACSVQACTMMFSFYVRNTTDRAMIIELVTTEGVTHDTLHLPMTRDRAQPRSSSYKRYSERLSAVEKEGVFIFHVPPQATVFIDRGPNMRMGFHAKELRIPSDTVFIHRDKLDNGVRWSGRWTAVCYDIIGHPMR